MKNVNQVFEQFFENTGLANERHLYEAMARELCEFSETAILEKGGYVREFAQELTKEGYGAYEALRIAESHVKQFALQFLCGR